MSIATMPDPAPSEAPELHSGDRMTQKEFHRIYELMPSNFRAELIGGIVYVASPLKRPHGTVHLHLAGLLFNYQSATPGVEASDNTTVILAEDSEPQPDCFLRILPEYAGQSKTSDDEYVTGPPELIAEIAVSSRSIDLNSKYDDYRRNGVREYLVVCVKEQVVRWFDLAADPERSIPEDGIIHSLPFPGLWINAPALLAKDSRQLLETLNRGLATPEHEEFLKRLAAAQQK
jgi:Uma2 family endonuclease